MNFRYTYIGILNLDFYNKCCTLLFIVIVGVLFLMCLSLLFFTRGMYLVASDLVYWPMRHYGDKSDFDFLITKFWVHVGRLDFYVQSKLLNFMQREEESLEIGWTLLPVFILLLLLIPSLNLLFLMDNTKLPVGEEFRTWMVTGHQWYWEYKTIKSDYNFNSSKVSIDIVRSMNIMEFAFLVDVIDFSGFGKDKLSAFVSVYREFHLNFIPHGSLSTFVADKSNDTICLYLDGDTIDLNSAEVCDLSNTLCDLGLSNLIDGASIDSCSSNIFEECRYFGLYNFIKKTKECCV